MNNTGVQPSLEDLGTPLSSVRFCVVDLETTGTNNRSGITEIGAVLVQGGEVLGEFNTLVNPGEHIPATITVLTGITDAMVSNAPMLSEAFPSFLQFADGAVLVAHNARFDVGFLKHAAAELGYEWPKFRVVDTLTLARHALLRDEVPNCKLSTLAAHFRTSVQPDHRALSDARATIDVLYGLLERVGTLGVTTLEDLMEFAAHVSPARRAKRVWAKTLPDAPGVYWFYTDNPGGRRADTSGREILYVGKATNLHRRVASYFTAAEQRSRMDEMVRIAQGVDYLVCATPLEAAVRELRLIAAHSPHFNRRSRRQERVLWLKLTRERWPRLSVVRRPTTSEDIIGPYTSRFDADQTALALQDAWRLRSCTGSVGKAASSGCLLAGLDRCLAPCLGTDDDEYEVAVAGVREAITSDLRPTLRRVGSRVQALSESERFEDAGVLANRLTTYAASLVRKVRLTSIASCPEIVAAKFEDNQWQIHVVRFGMLASARVAPAGFDPRSVAEQAVAEAATLLPPPPGLPACSIEEATLVADWLEQADVRIISIDGEWAWPLTAGVTNEAIPGLVLNS